MQKMALIRGAVRGHTRKVTSPSQKIVSSSVDSIERSTLGNTSDRSRFRMMGPEFVPHESSFGQTTYAMALSPDDLSVRVLWNANVGQPIGEPLIHHQDTISFITVSK